MSQTKAQLIDAVDGSIVTADLADDAVNAAKLASNAVVNASVDASAAIAGSKINPSFTSNVTITNTAPALVLVDSDHNSDFNIQASGGLLNFNDSTNSATRISITSDGKVNFGSVARVEVDGVFKSAHGSAATPAYNFLNDNDNGMFRATTNTIGFSTAGTERVRINSSGHFLPATDSTYNIGADATRFANGYFDTLYGDGSNLTGITGITIANNTNNRIITATGNANSVNAETNLTFSGTSLIQSGNHVLKHAITDSSGLKISQEASNVAQIFNHYAGPMTFGVNNTEKMRIDSSGRVGIGTTSPTTLLNLNVDTEANLGSGSEGIRLTSGSSNAQFVRLGSSYSNNSVTGPGTLLFSSNKLSLRCDNGNPITFHTGSTVAERMRITSDGPHLLLGGTSDVNEITESSANAGMVIGGTGFGNAGLAIITSTSGTGRLYFGDAVANAAGRNRGQINYGHSDDHMRFVTAGTERMRIDSSGRVGIGTTSPLALLDVSVLGSGARRLLVNYADSLITVQGANSSSTNENLRITGDNLIFSSGSGTGTERMRIDSSGRVLLGTTTTGRLARLHISGDNFPTFALGGSQVPLIVSNQDEDYGLQLGTFSSGNGAIQVTRNDGVATAYNLQLQPSGGSVIVGNSSTGGDILFANTSGGIVLGSTTNVDSNTLDDYEEGTFAPMTATQAEVYHARYTKVGNKVTINTCFEMKNNQNSQFISLPFLPNNDNAGANNNLQSAVNNRYAGTVSFFDNGTTVVNLMLFHQGNQGSSAYFLAQNQNGSQTWPKTVDNNDFGKIGVSFTYQTAA
tara:strand:- start:196 stop:2601 length:2406 start_codon:yes stop_codon:yes gene_type:complete